MNLWQNWLNALTQTQQSATQTASSNAAQMASQFTQQYAAQWQQACQQWQQSMEGAWTTPASFWQTVASIQSARARCIAEICQQHPKYIAQLFQCTSYPQLIECLTRWNGHTLSSLISLNVTTQAQRSHLWSQWQQQMPFAATSQASLAKMWNTSSFWTNTQTPSAFTNFGNTAPRASAAQPQTQQAATAPQPQATQQQTTAPSQAASAPAPAQTGTVQHASSSTAQQAATSTQQLNLMNGESPTISSTANSVMRAANGNTVAAAAAARRSVVARRVANNRRRVAR